MTIKKPNVISIFISLFLIAIIVFIFFRNKERGANIPEVTLEHPFIEIIKITKKIRGTIVAAHSIDIKPKISGVIDKIYISIGEQITNGQAIAKIRIIPSPDEIDDAQKNFETHKIQYQLDNKLYENNLRVYEKGGVSQAKIKEVEAKMKLSKLNYDASLRRLEMISKSNVRGVKNKDFTIVHSTLNGTVLEIPFQKGCSVSKRTSNSDGTTIAKVANMDSLIFKSKINESDIAKIHIGMNLQLSISFMDSLKVIATISEISPQSRNENGVNKFNFSAKLSQKNQRLSYSGITATADIILGKTDSVLCIKEKYLQFDNDKPYVEIWSNKEKIKYDLETGLSDGINVEIKEGLTITDRLILPAWGDE